jgi:penicillin-insensitive murein DD-endopeptidase
MPRAHILLAILLAAAAGPARAQDKGTLNPEPLPPLANPADPKTPAKELFGRKVKPIPMQARSIGFYAHGCLAGAVALPVNGRTWQVMRLSRNRMWGHPNLIAFLERLADKAPKVGWPGLLVGDMSQARGGPMITGHASHQVGLDVDLWLTPMPHRELSREEREEMSATMAVAADRRDVDPKVWTPAHTAIIRAAAEDPVVDRIFVNAAIKNALCREAGTNRAWLHKVRPWWGHDYHFHVRIKCPGDSGECESQPEPGITEGCGHDLDYWFKESILHPPPPKEPPKKKPPLTPDRAGAVARRSRVTPRPGAASPPPRPVAHGVWRRTAGSVAGRGRDRRPAS